MRRRDCLALAAVASIGALAGSQLRSADYSAPRLLLDADAILARGDAPLQLLLILRSDCRGCNLMKPRWERLVAIVPDSVTIRVIASTSDTGSGLRVAGERVRYERAPSEVLAEIGVEFVPTTMVLNQDGRVIFQETGVLSKEKMDSLIELLGGAP